jgi:hypothetical protein
MGDLIQTTFDYGVLDEAKRVRVQVKAESIKARMKRTAEDIIAIGLDLIAVKEELGHGQFLQWISAEFGMSQKTSSNFMHVADRFGEDIKLVNFTNFPASILYELAAPSTSDSVVSQVQSGEIPPTLEAIKAAKEAEKRAKEAEAKAQADAKAAQQMLFNLKQSSQTEIEKLTKQIQDLKNDLAKDPEIIEERKKELEKKIWAYEQERKELEQGNQQKLYEDLAKQRKEQENQLKQKLKQEEDNLKKHYAEKDQQRQFKAENTIRGLLSHGIKSLAETQQTIEHIISDGMFQAVQHIGGTQQNSLLAQIQSLSETLARAEEKLTQGDYIVLAERISVNG